jgi:type IV pilus assembly protein PilM
MTLNRSESVNLQSITSLWKRRPDRLGVDFDSHSLRLVKLVQTSESVFDIAACGLINISLRQAAPADQQRLHAFIRQTGGGLSRAAVNIDDPSLRIRRMVFAKMPERDLIEAIKWNFREHIDCPIEEYQVDYTQIEGWNEGGRLAYAAFGVSKKAIKEHIEIARQAGLKPVALEPQATALLAAFDYNMNWQPKQAIVCIAIGDSSTYFTVMAEGQLLFSRPMLGISLDSLVKFVSHGMNVDEQDAERIISENLAYGETNVTVPPEIADVMSAYYSQLVIETQRSIDAFTILFGVERVDTIYLCGIGAYCPGIVSHMQKSVGVPAQIFNPFANVSAEKLDGQVRARAAIFAVAFGLAIP